jgi:electron transfer flavoprotein alpha subunit
MPAVAGQPVRVIDDPACLILVVLGGADDFGAAGADRVIGVAGPGFEGYAPEARAATTLAAIARFAPRHVLVPESPSGGDLGRRVAARLGQRLAGNVQRIEAAAIVRRGRGGGSDFTGPPPRLLAIAPEVADPVIGERFEARPLALPPVETTPRLIDHGLAPVDPSRVPLQEAELICAAGNGVTDWAEFRALAAAIGAAEGGSRVVCDAGHLPHERQIGASGTQVEPRCYLAFGISGAPQHLQGITRSERVVAVNTDRRADMVQRADLAVIQDAQAVMRALRQLVEARREAAADDA